MAIPREQLTNYHYLLAQILLKAQGVECAETGELVDIGEEVVALRKLLDAITPSTHSAQRPQD